MVFLNKNYWLSILYVSKCRTKVMYGESFLGRFWSLIRPIAFASVYAVVFSSIMPKSQGFDYVNFIINNALFWFFICNIISASPALFIDSKDILQQSLYPRSSIVMVFVFNAIENYLISFVSCNILLLIIGHFVFSKYLILIPIYFIWSIFIMIFASLIIAYLNPFLRDIALFIESFLPILIWTAPIMYSIDMVPNETIKFLMNYNPIYILIKPLSTILSYGLCPSVNDVLKCLILSILLIGMFMVIYRLTDKKIHYYL